MSAHPALLTTAEVAARLGLKPRYVRHLTASGALPHIKIGRLVRVDERDLRVFVADRKVPGGSS